MNGPKIIIDAMVERLNKYLGELNMTQYKLAMLSGVPYSTIKHIMQKRTKSVDLRTIIMLAYGLGITPAEFLDDPCFLYENLDI